MAKKENGNSGINIRKKTDEKYPQLKKIVSKDQTAFEELTALKKDVAFEVEEFWKGVSDDVKELASSSEISSSDVRYLFYEGLRQSGRGNAVIPNQKFLESKKGGEEVLKQIKSAIEAYNGVENFDAPAPNLALSLQQNLATLRGIQIVAQSRYRSDTHMRAVVRTFVEFIFGNGIKISCNNEDIESKLNEKMAQMNCNTLYKDLCKSGLLNGEAGLMVRSRIDKQNKTVEFSAQEIDSNEITSVEVSTKNPANKLTYSLDFQNEEAEFLSKKNNTSLVVPDIEYLYTLSNRGTSRKLDWTKSGKHKGKGLSKGEVMQFLKFGNKKRLRGDSPVEPILRPLRLHEDFIINRAILNFERSKVLYVHKQKGGNTAKLAGLNTNKSKAPKGGVQLNLYQNEDYEIKSPSLHAQDAEKDGLLFLYEASSGSGIPISIIGQRNDEANANALKNADSPFGQTVLGYATFYDGHIADLVKFVLRRMVEAGELPPKTKIKTFMKESTDTDFALDILTRLREKEDPNTIIQSLSGYEDNMKEIEIDTENMPIEVIIADAVRPNPLEMAKVWFIYRKMGIISRQTLSNKAGLVWEQELFRQMKEKEFFPDGKGDGETDGTTDKTDPGIDDAGSPDGSQTPSNVSDGSGLKDE